MKWREQQDGKSKFFLKPQRCRSLFFGSGGQFIDTNDHNTNVYGCARWIAGLADTRSNIGSPHYILCAPNTL
jgi:hypothetical protein